MTLYLAISNTNLSLNDTLTLYLYNENNTIGESNDSSWTLYSSNGTKIASVSDTNEMQIDFTSTSELYTELVTNGVTSYYAEDANSNESQSVTLNYFDNSNFTSISPSLISPIIGARTITVSIVLNSSAPLPTTVYVNGTDTYTIDNTFINTLIIETLVDSDSAIIEFKNGTTTYATYVLEKIDSFYYYSQDYNNYYGEFVLYSNGEMNISIEYDSNTYSIYSSSYYNISSSVSKSTMFNSFTYILPSNGNIYSFVGTTALNNTISYSNTAYSPITITAPINNYVVYNGNSTSIKFSNDTEFDVTLNGTTVATDVTEYTAQQTNTGNYKYSASLNGTSIIEGENTDEVNTYFLKIYTPSEIFLPGSTNDYTQISFVPTTQATQNTRIVIYGSSDEIYSFQGNPPFASFYFATYVEGTGNIFIPSYIEFFTSYGDIGVILSVDESYSYYLLTNEIEYQNNNYVNDGITFSTNPFSVSNISNFSGTYTGPTMQLNSIYVSPNETEVIKAKEYFGYSQGVKTFKSINGKRNMFSGISKNLKYAELINTSGNKEIYSNTFVQKFMLPSTAEINIIEDSTPETNFYFTDQNGNKLQAWIETVNENLYAYVLCPEFPASNKQNIYMNFTSLTSIDTTYLGFSLQEFSSLSDYSSNTDYYAKFDNGSNVFDYYMNNFTSSNTNLFNDASDVTTTYGYGMKLSGTLGFYNYLGIGFGENSLYNTLSTTPSVIYEINYTMDAEQADELYINLGFMQNSSENVFNTGSNFGTYMENFLGFQYNTSTDSTEPLSFYYDTNQNVVNTVGNSDSYSHPSSFTFNGIEYQYFPWSISTTSYAMLLNNGLTTGSIYSLGTYLSSTYLYPVLQIYSQSTGDETLSITVNNIKIYKAYTTDNS